MLLATWLGASVLLVVLHPPWAAAAAGPAAVAGLPSCQQSGPCVVVQVVQGTDVVDSHTFSSSEIVDDGDFNASNKESVPVKGGTAEVVESGSSLRRLVGLVVDPRDATFAEVVGPDAYGRHLLTKDELLNPFPGGLVPAFYVRSAGADQLNYVRPQRNSDDANGSVGPDLGLLLGDPGGALVVTVHLTGAPLDVDVTATPADDSSRSFALGTDPTGATYTFGWRFPGGTTSADQTPTYAFPADSLAGSYPVTVGVQAPDGSFGWGSTTLQVGPKPTQSASPSPTPGTGGDGPGDSGPTHRPTHSGSGEPDPDPGDGTATPTGPDTSVPTLPTSPTELPTPTAATSGATAAPPADPGPTPTEPTPTPTPTTGSGDQVTGILLTAAQAGGSSGQVVSDAPTPSSAARPLSDPPFTVGTTAWVLTGLALLLLAGAGSESAGLRRRLARWLARAGLGRWSKMGP